MDSSAVVEQVAEAADLSGVLELLSRMEGLLTGLIASNLIVGGVVLGAAVILLLAVMWR